MTVTISYSLLQKTDLSNQFEDDPAITGLSNGGFMTAAEDVFIIPPIPPFIPGITLFNADVQAYGADAVADGTAQTVFNPAFSPSIVQLDRSSLFQLTPPNVVVAYESGTDVHFRIISATGETITGFNDTAIADTNLSNPDVAVLRGVTSSGGFPPLLSFTPGGFVIASEDTFTATDHDIQLNFFDNSGVQTGVVNVDSTVGTLDTDAQVVQLDNGNVAVAWMRTAGTDTAILYAVYNRDGSATVLGATVLDATGSTNRDPAIVATDTGFAVLYKETGTTGGPFPLATASIKMAGLDFDGNILGSRTLVSTVLGSVDDVDAVRLRDGLMAFSYTSQSAFVGADDDVIVQITEQAHDGTSVSPAVEIVGDTVDTQDAARSALAAFGTSQLAGIYEDTTDNLTRGETFDIFRLHTSDAASDIFTGAGLLFDSFIGGAGTDTVDYSAETTAMSIDLGTNIATGGRAAGDRFDAAVEGLIGGSGNDTFVGTAANNVFTGGAGNDTMSGNDGADWFNTGIGNDSVAGGLGVDMMSFGDTATGVTVNLAALTATSGAVSTAFSGIENVTGSALAADFLTGDADANRMRGLGGYDWFFGTAGGDTFEGGTGLDMVSYSTAAAGVTLDFRTGEGTRGLADGHSYVDIERATGTIHDDIFFGSAGSQNFRGLGGADIFVGSGGGRETYDGGTGVDTVSYFVSTAGVTASLLLGRGTGGDASLDFYLDIQNLTGSNLNDRLIGDHAINYLRGNGGRDTIQGLGGNDRFYGGAGDDSIDGGLGFDYVFFTGNEDDYAVSTVGDVTTVRFLPGGGDGIDTLINTEILRFADGDILL